MILAIDPGSKESGYVVIGSDKRLYQFGKISNEKLLHVVRGCKTKCHKLVIEQIKSYGNAMGDTVIETCIWTGRFIEAWDKPFELIPRKTVCANVCRNPRANDSNIRRAILDVYADTFAGELGGGAEPSVGTKRERGPLYGVKADVFSAIALALTWYDSLLDDDLDFLK